MGKGWRGGFFLRGLEVVRIFESESRERRIDKRRGFIFFGYIYILWKILRFVVDRKIGWIFQRL